MKTRKELEFLIRDYAEISGIVSINPNVSTHLGRITMLDGSANLIEEVGGDWCIQGSLQQLTCNFYPNPKHYTFRVTKVDNIQEDDQPPFITWTADVHVEACTHEIHWKYDRSKDTFLQQLTESGFDMTDWELPTRQKTPYKEFLSSICSHYKDYNLINLIEIG